jgi:Rad3-related DNA helicase
MRDEEGFGVVTVLDERILTKGYGKEFLKILPPIKVIYLPPEEGAEWIRNWIREKEGDPL